MKRSCTLLFAIIAILLAVCALSARAGDNRSKKTCADEKPFEMSYEYDEKTARFTMSFEEKDLVEAEPEKLRYFKRQKFFHINESFELPEELWKALGAPQVLVIKKGRYPIEYKDGIYTIVLFAGL